jgi:hypothetical protein
LLLEFTREFQQRTFGVDDYLYVLGGVSATDVTRKDSLELGISVIEIDFYLSTNEEIAFLVEDPLPVLTAYTNAQMDEVG